MAPSQGRTIIDIRLNVNGATRSVDTDPDTPLLYVLRNDLQLNGAKYGCGMTQCGACTVHIGGVAVRSCQMPIATVKTPVTTIEGLSADASHPVQQAWIAENVPQCGYCQSGMIMAVEALLTGLIDYALDRKVVLCSPLNLYTFLVVVRQAADSFHTERTAAEIVQLINRFQKQWNEYVSAVDAVRSNFNKLQESLDTISSGGTRFRMLNAQFAKIEKVRRREHIAELPVASDERLLDDIDD